MVEVSLLAALGAGVLSLLSPCSALLLPSFFAYAFASPRALLTRTLAFYVGLLSTLVPLGSGVAAISGWVTGNRELLINLAGALIIVFGVLMLLGRGFALPGTERLRTWAEGRGAGRGGHLSTAGLGAVYGLAGFCSGPVLGAILAVASFGSALRGGVLLAVYALGMALPLFVLALLWQRFDLGSRSWLRGRELRLGPVLVHSTSLVSGLLFVVIGVLFIAFDGTAGLTGVLGLGDSEVELTAEQAWTRIADAVPWWLLPGVVAVIALLLVARRYRPADEDGATQDQHAQQ